MNLKLRIILPSDILFSEDGARLVTIPGTRGVFGVMFGHAKYISNIKIGVITAEFESSVKRYYVHGGVAEVKGEEVNILTEFAYNLDKIKESFVMERISEIQSEMKIYGVDSLEYKIYETKIEKYQSLKQYMG